jgi:hypothetical protein
MEVPIFEGNNIGGTMLPVPSLLCKTGNPKPLLAKEPLNRG